MRAFKVTYELVDNGNRRVTISEPMAIALANASFVDLSLVVGDLTESKDITSSPETWKMVKTAEIPLEGCTLYMVCSTV